MTGKTHMIVGVSSMACLWALCPEGIPIKGQVMLPQIAMLTAAIGSYAPDIDIEQSALGQKYRLISKHLKHRGLTHYFYVIPLIIFALLLVGVTLPNKYALGFNIAIGILGLITIAKLIFSLIKKGNAEFDDIIQGVCFGITTSMIIANPYTREVFSSVVFGFLFGWLMHIFADAFNGKGIPLVPGQKKVHIMSVDTGTWQEVVWLLCYESIIIFLTIKGVYL